MRSPKYFSVACRAPNGEIVLVCEHIESTWIGRQKWLKLPFLRGSLALLDSMALGHRALKFASNVQISSEYQPEGSENPTPAAAPKADRNLKIYIPSLLIGLVGIVLIYFFAPDLIRQSLWKSGDTTMVHRILYGLMAAWAVAWLLLIEKIPGIRIDASSELLEDEISLDPPLRASGDPSKGMQEASVAFAMFMGLAIGLLLFNYLPNLVIENLLHVDNYRYKNLGTEVLKMALFLGYVYGIGRIPELKRVFCYHGAEHKAINTLEAHQELNEENCLAQTRLHPRCGTSFAIVVLLVSMLLFTFVPRYPIEALRHNVVGAVTVRFGLEIIVLPFVAGISYELIRFAGKFKNSNLIRALFWPGLMTQYLTTNEPDASQVEVALTALKAVVEAEAKDGATGQSVDEAAAVIA